ncbi:FAD-dependent oxidoreductase [Streptomyces sp. NPDC008139]|uniref:FAD-dependent oxidoreductase n=1 Tax=Streptomyces sp. NPDC008139 TaxID=3364814 RepID=UPI0036E36661
MKKRIVILGNGSTGILAANRLRRRYDESEFQIVVVGKYDTRDHEVELLMAIGVLGSHTLLPPEDGRLRAGIDFRHTEIGSVDVARREVCCTDGSSIGYDVLVVATGARPVPTPDGVLYGGARYVVRSAGLGDACGLVRVDPRTLQSRATPEVFAIGAATGTPADTGAGAHVAVEHLVAGVREFLTRTADQASVSVPAREPRDAAQPS